jgi:hypothetical protein
MTLTRRLKKLEKTMIPEKLDPLGCILLATDGTNDEEIERICAERDAMTNPNSNSVHTIVLVPGKKR